MVEVTGVSSAPGVDTHVNLTADVFSFLCIVRCIFVHMKFIILCVLLFTMISFGYNYVLAACLFC